MTRTRKTTMLGIMRISICFVLLGVCFARRPFEQPECTENLVFQACGSACPMTCEKPYRGTCSKKCVAKCECPMEKPILHNGRCITQSECTLPGRTPAVKPSQATNTTLPVYFRCPEGQEFQECGSGCNRTCADGQDYASCHKACVTRCGCPSIRPYWHEEKCIAYDKCPKGAARDLGTDSELSEKERRNFYDSAWKRLQDQLSARGIKLTNGR